MKLPQNPFTEEETIQFICTALENPKSLTHCTNSIAAALLYIFPPDSIVHNITPQRRNDLLKTLFAFVTARRSLDEHDDLTIAFAFCADCLGMRVPTEKSIFFHRAWQMFEKSCQGDSGCSVAQVGKGQCYYDHPLSASLFINQTFSCLSQLFRTSNFKSVSAGTSKTWPTKTADLVPHGPDQLMLSFRQWSNAFRVTVITGSAIAALHLCRSILYESFAKFRWTHLTFDGTKRFLEAIVDSLSAPGFSPRLQELSDGMLHQFSSFFVLLGEASANSVPTEAARLLIGGFEVKAVQICSMILYVMPLVRQRMNPLEGSLDDYDLNYIVRRALYYGGFFHFLYNMGQDSSGGFITSKLLLHPFIAMSCRERSFCGLIEGVDYEAGLARFWHNGIDNRCSSYNCIEGIESVGREFKRCGGCQAVFYCGKRCQQADWKNDEIPHRQLCPVLRKVVEASNIRTGPHCEGRCKPFHTRLREAPCTHIVRLIREAIDRAMLNEDEGKILQEWGRKIHKMLVLDRSVPNVSGSGYEDYDDLLVRFTDPEGVFAGPKAEIVTTERCYRRIDDECERVLKN